MLLQNEVLSIFKMLFLSATQFLGKLSHTGGQGCAKFDWFWLELDGQMNRGDMPVVCLYVRTPFPLTCVCVCVCLFIKKD